MRTSACAARAKREPDAVATPLLPLFWPPLLSHTPTGSKHPPQIQQGRVGGIKPAPTRRRKGMLAKNPKPNQMRRNSAAGSMTTTPGPTAPNHTTATLYGRGYFSAVRAPTYRHHGPSDKHAAGYCPSRAKNAQTAHRRAWPAVRDPHRLTGGRPWP